MICRNHDWKRFFPVTEAYCGTMTCRNSEAKHGTMMGGTSSSVLLLCIIFVYGQIILGIHLFFLLVLHDVVLDVTLYLILCDIMCCWIEFLCNLKWAVSCMCYNNGPFVVWGVIIGWRNKFKMGWNQNVNGLKIDCKWAENKLKNNLIFMLGC